VTRTVLSLVALFVVSAAFGVAPVFADSTRLCNNRCASDDDVTVNQDNDVDNSTDNSVTDNSTTNVDNSVTDNSTTDVDNSVDNDVKNCTATISGNSNTFNCP
jgi:hypothetical protein